MASNSTNLQALWLQMAQIDARPAHWSGPLTDNQLTAVNAMMSTILSDHGKDRDNRLAVFSVLVHSEVPILTTRDLRKWEASKLIDWMKADPTDPQNWEVRNDARRCIGWIEGVVKECLYEGVLARLALEQPDAGDPPEPDLPYLQEAVELGL